jgi:threonine/homoserine/homoserine lactone efflux protein
MISPESLLAFGLTSVLLSLAPGPDNIFVLTQSALYGRKSGFLVTLGLSTGLLFHTAAVALGVAAIFQTSAMAFTLLKLAGAAYLLYLAWGAFRAGSEKIDGDGNQPALPAATLYRRGIIMNITNPKVSIFFLAFLPQFVVPENGSVALQIFFLGAIFIVATLVVFNTIAILAAKLGDWLNRSPKAQIYLNRVAGTVFVGLAAKLLSSSQD